MWSSRAISLRANANAFLVSSLVFATACSGGKDDAHVASAPSSPARTEGAQAAAPLGPALINPHRNTAFARLSFLGGVSDDVEIARIRAEGPQRFTPVGTTSVVFKVVLADGSLASFRPRTRTHPRGWLAELAAYRIARALELDQVPVATTRTIRRRDLDARFDPEKRDRYVEIDRNIVWNDNDEAIGATVPWVPHLRDLGFESADGVRTWAPWLALGTPVPTSPQRNLARDLSCMLAFDYLIANFDRMSGGNLKSNEEGTRVVIRDHNLAFTSPFPEIQRGATEHRFMRVERFSRSFVMSLRDFDRAALDRAFVTADQEAREPVLTEAQRDDVMTRRDTILARVAELISSHDESSVLAFD